ANILREKTKKYKDTLVNTARDLLTETMEPGMGLLGLFEEPFQLISRLKWLNKESWKSRKMASISAILVSAFFVAFVLPMGELNKIVPPNQMPFTEPTFEDADDYRNVITSLNAELNEAFINWDFETIEKFYTEDAILDQESLPPVEGLINIINDFKQQKKDGLKFNSLENYIIELWRDGNNINVLESYDYSINLKEQRLSGNFSIDVEDLRLSGTGSSFTIWEIQENDSIKIKYSILNLDNISPTIN
ncbi:MAG: hypothetical protein R3250_11100, partial [Melioribacteraceae bacterium]|nr:hypothetical protein [Melioribacteraceae bacterium]